MYYNVRKRPLLNQPEFHRWFAPPYIQLLDLYRPAINQCSYPAPRYLSGTSMLIFTDGACLDNGRTDRHPRAGFGFVFRPNEPGKQTNVSRALEHSDYHVPTSNRAELRAAIAALQFREWDGEGADEVVIATDSEYLVLGICDRIHLWVERGWLTAARKPVANRDLWEILLDRVCHFERMHVAVKFWHIPREWNTEADRLAKEGAHKVPAAQFTIISGVAC